MNDLQQWMQQALIRPDQVDANAVNKTFVPGAQLSAQACLGIYQRGYILRLTKCLAEQFPALSHALGEGLFDQFALRYLRIHPSDSYTLYELGRRFADFLEEDRPDKDLPPEQREGWVDFMVDLARYERLHFKLFDAPGHEGNPWPSQDTPDEQLKLQPCFALAQYRYPVAWYYHAIKENKQTPFPPKQPSPVALLRKDYQVTTYPLNPVHYHFLGALQQQGDIESALVAVSKAFNSPLEQVRHSWQTEVKARWIEAGFFVLS